VSGPANDETSTSRFALIGCGQFGSFVAAAVERMPKARLVAVADRDHAAATALARQLSAEVAVFDAAGAALDGNDVEIAIVATPPWTHVDLTVQALDAGCHVLVEKPLAIDLDGCRRVAIAATANDRVVAVDHLLRHAPLVAAVDRLLRAGEPGRRLLGNVHRFSFENDAADEGLGDEHWFWDRSRSGGVLVEHGVHFFDLASWFIGAPPANVQATTLGQRAGRIDTVCATATYSNRATATWYHSFTHRRVAERQHWRLGLGDTEIRLDGWVPLSVEVDVTGGDVADAVEVVLADITASPEVQSLGLHAGRRRSGSDGDRVVVTLEHRGSDAKQRVYRHCIDALLADLLDAVNGGHPPVTGLAPATAAVSLAVAATDAADSGRTVSVMPHPSATGQAGRHVTLR
jgi:predicted dehydrogenase